ncbi:hypothetical protein L207DRAFT_575280 [Hyaloscypha variabilis F]|uniref:DUF7707 domain-containing protein n=1 Tax=Hyaloscypha variabilis (strain UAMH 11265 / GT02V1 / F) TaxID=1149755 RepID=A0A2J6SD05_HYAVF|nr:hypothetical protein L207DRAFT_575280 [Hyaloscypha variabilis F]
MFVKATVAVALLASFVAAQTNLTFDPSIVGLTIRGQWCQAEFNTCNTLCGKTTDSNTCDPNTLNFTCTCTNGSAPGLQYYTQTMPTFICEENFSLCNAAAVNDTDSAAAQAACLATEKADCGQLDPANFTAVSSASTASATPTPASSGSASGSTATTSSSKAGAATMAAMRNLGSGAFAVGAGVVLGAFL